jgi:hypothetical protein
MQSLKGGLHGMRDHDMGVGMAQIHRLIKGCIGVVKV